VPSFKSKHSGNFLLFKDFISKNKDKIIKIDINIIDKITKPIITIIKELNTKDILIKNNKIMINNKPIIVFISVFILIFITSFS
jgi:hypothetical protein